MSSQAHLFEQPPGVPRALPDDVTLSARVSATMRRRVLEARQPGERQSDTVRRLLELALDTVAAAESKLDATGSARRRDGSTAKDAAAGVNAGTARYLALAAISDTGAAGMTTDQVIAALAPRPLNSTARRVTDLAQARLITPIAWREERPGYPYADAGVFGNRGLAFDEHEGTLHGQRVVTRHTRRGAAAVAYTVTALGLTVLGNARRKAAADA